jgi:hypothetical protein
MTLNKREDTEILEMATTISVETVASGFNAEKFCLVTSHDSEKMK